MCCRGFKSMILNAFSLGCRFFLQGRSGEVPIRCHTTLAGRRNVRSAVPYPASVPSCTPRPGLVEGHYGESRSLCKATILPAGGGAEELPRPVTRQRHKRRAALDRVSVTPLHELTSSRAAG